MEKAVETKKLRKYSKEVSKSRGRFSKPSNQELHSKTIDEIGEEPQYIINTAELTALKREV
jgi:hypothetical protein